MNEPIVTAAPPPNPAGGCCGMGCATLFALIFFFAIALVGGGIWAVHHFKHEYTSSEPVMISDEKADEAIAAETRNETVIPTSVPHLETQWKEFEKAGRRNEKARIVLSAAQINSLLQNNKNTRDKVYVSIENNLGHVRVSIPLKNVPLMKDRYLNGEGTVKSSPDGDPGKAEISTITLSGHAVPDSIMDQRFFGGSSMRTVISDWLNKQKIETFRIENNSVISETRGE